MITTNRMQDIMVSITLGTIPRGKDEEEKRFIEKVKFDIESIIAAKGIVEIPPEFPDFD